ncbi:MAG: acylphosphatase, partial [Selenomonadaceae bacterium]|nr:acylphosphatase [Selenomonadaceae bacterium]
MIWKHGAFAVLLSVVWLLVFLMPVSAAERILEVRSEVHAQTGLPVTVQERMQKSVAAIAEQLLSGRVLPLQPAERREKERVIHEVFDKVLVGYSVRSVRIEEQPTACVHVELVPWDDLVQEVRV